MSADSASSDAAIYCGRLLTRVTTVHQTILTSRNVCADPALERRQISALLVRRQSILDDLFAADAPRVRFCPASL
jgi:hypothetical protein